DRLAEVGGQREDLLVPEPVDATLADRRRELVELVPARGLLLTEFLSVPDDRIGQGRADEDLARIEREAVGGLLSGRRLADHDPVDDGEAVRGHAPHHVGDPRVRTHRDDCGDLPIQPTRVQRELLEDPALLPRYGGTVSRAVDIAAPSLEARLHDTKVVRR